MLRTRNASLHPPPPPPPSHTLLPLPHRYALDIYLCVHQSLAHQRSAGSYVPLKPSLSGLSWGQRNARERKAKTGQAPRAKATCLCQGFTIYNSNHHTVHLLAFQNKFCTQLGKNILLLHTTLLQGWVLLRIKPDGEGLAHTVDSSAPYNMYYSWIFDLQVNPD